MEIRKLGFGVEKGRDNFL